MKPAFYVLYDGDCGLCRHALQRLLALDFFHCLTPVNARDRNLVEKSGLGRLESETLMKDIHAVEGEKVWQGYEAYRAIAGQLPVLWPAWPFLWVWPMTWLGRRMYRHVADTRSCEIPSVRR